MKVCVIGCGGIGSYFAQHIDKLIDLDQIDSDKMSFEFFDDDVVEPKNILYQNFEPEETDQNKTEALSFRLFNLTFTNKRVSLDDLRHYELIILCADNNIIRREAYANWQKYNIPFIDSRANGRCIGIFSSDTPKYLTTIDGSSESTSCQNPFQINDRKIEYGNVAIAALLAQTVLTYYRTQRIPNDLMLIL